MASGPTSTRLSYPVQRAALSLFVLLVGTAQAQTIQAWVPPFDDAQAGAIAALDRAQSTVDVAQYNIRSEAFHQELLALRARGVRVRIVVDQKNAVEPYNTLDDVLEAEGFELRRHENTSAAYAIMHHKFTVIDGARVLTGSYNWNETAQLVNDENMLLLEDAGLAAAYQAEFEELWSDGPDAPSVGTGAGCEVRFSPDDRPRDAILALIAGAQRSVRVAVFAFHDERVARALAAAAARGVQVTLLTEKKQADNTGADEIVATGGGRVIVGANTSSTYSAMHQKFALIDDATLITGACNWTFTAFERSNEDVLIVRDATVVRRYLDAFAGLVRRYDAARYDAAEYGIGRAESTVHLVVRCPFTGFGDAVVVTGEDPALGGWDPARGVALETTDGIFPTWTGRVRLPAGARVRWKAVVRGPNGALWELGDDRILEVDAAGTDQVEDVSFRATVDVSVTASLPALPPGAELRLVGADPLLGSWNPSAAVPLRDDGAGRFTATVPLPGRASICCKLVLVAADGSPTWEAGEDRVLLVHDRDAPEAIELGAFR